MNGKQDVFILLYSEYEIKTLIFQNISDQLKEEHLLIKDIQGQYSSRLQNLESSLHHPQQSLLFFYWIAKGY